MSLISSIFKTNRFPFQSGFGLVELLVSISIMGIVAAIIFARQDSFDKAVLLTNQAYEVALSLRQVQLSAVSAAGNSGEFRRDLGLFFDDSDDNNRRYVAFEDKNHNGWYDSSSDTVLVEPKGILDPRFEIRSLRLGSDHESPVAVIFKRPNFDAEFYTAANNQSAETVLEVDIARVGTDGLVKTVEVTATGQISVK